MISSMRIKPILFFGVVALLAGFILYSETGGIDRSSLAVGSPAPDFVLKDQTGQEVRLSDYRGKLVFLNFWATWCSPCVDEMPEMDLMNRAFEGRPFQMLAVSVDTSWGLIRQFYDDHNIDLPTLLDPGRRASSLYQVFKFPETYIIDKQGRIVQKIVGPKRWADPQVMAEIDDMIRDQEVDELEDLTRKS